LGNAFKIIELVVDYQAEGLSFTQILKESGLPRSSAHRLLKELTGLNILTYEAETKTYRGGFSLFAVKKAGYILIRLKPGISVFGSILKSGNPFHCIVQRWEKFIWLSETKSCEIRF